GPVGGAHLLVELAVGFGAETGFPGRPAADQAVELLAGTAVGCGRAGKTALGQIVDGPAAVGFVVPVQPLQPGVAARCGGWCCVHDSQFKQSMWCIAYAAAAPAQARPAAASGAVR